jgi:hypothetical protein
MAVGSRAQAETQYTPSVSLSQRYDSNVFFAAKQFVPQGSQSWDLVSALRANLEILNKSRLGDTSVRAGVDGNAYAYNSNLSYASANVRASSDLSDWAQEVLPGLQLRISDAFRYTPQAPAFSFSGAGATQFGGPQQSDVFSSGLQGARADSYSNILSTQGDYSFSRSVGLRANYSYSILHVGRLYLPPSATSTAFNYFDTTVHNVAFGPTFTLDSGDTLFLKFNYLSSEQTNTAATRPQINFNTKSIEPEYVTRFMRDWTARISGGATVIDSQSSSETIFSGSFFLTNDFDRQTRVAIEISRQAVPLHIGIGGALIRNVAQLHVSYDFSRVLQLTVRGGYSNNESAPVKSFTSETLDGSAVLDYNLTRSTKVSLSQTYSNFERTGFPVFDRLVTMLAVSTEW